MQLTLSLSSALSQTSDSQAHASQLQNAASSAQCPKLSMVWHQEFDGKRTCMVARWIVA
ncbi:MAG: hypothetical protein HY785_26285 [Oscillatoriophycideae cyanobacterium NC_groundwater_1537_Pr4_S-0.65um_50_18]|nr:hypothetical protein [Oscillatoriophycideae cyanobacterium NC_groundwater_1537_Pr4_S-0.65um_50_18]